MSFKFDMSNLKRVVGDQIAQAEIEVPCPGCSTKNRVRGQDIAREETFVCAGCGEKVKLRDEGGEFARLIQGG